MHFVRDLLNKVVQDKQSSLCRTGRVHPIEIPEWSRRSECWVKSSYEIFGLKTEAILLWTFPFGELSIALWIFGCTGGYFCAIGDDRGEGGLV